MIGAVCECGHDHAVHGRPRCMALDSYGVRCECDGYIRDRSEDEDLDDYPEDDANDHIQRRTVARSEEIAHGQSCTQFYDSQWRLADESGGHPEWKTR